MRSIKRSRSSVSVGSRGFIDLRRDTCTLGSAVDNLVGATASMTNEEIHAPTVRGVTSEAHTPIRNGWWGQSDVGGWDPTGYSMGERAFKPVGDTVGKWIIHGKFRDCMHEFKLRHGGPTVQRPSLKIGVIFMSSWRWCSY